MPLGIVTKNAMMIDVVTVTHREGKVPETAIEQAARRARSRGFVPGLSLDGPAGVLPA